MLTILNGIFMVSIVGFFRFIRSLFSFIYFILFVIIYDTVSSAAIHAFGTPHDEACSYHAPHS